MDDEFDVVVVGGGPGGYGAALYGAAAGLNVVMVERDQVGGTCLHRGCIPAKQFLETASVFRTVAGAKEFGVEADQPSLDFAVSQARKQNLVATLTKGLASLLTGRKVTVLAGTGTLGPDRSVTVTSENGDNAQVRGRHIILASGSAPRSIPGFEVDGKVVLTSDDVLALDRLPATAVVIGGGAIGCEFASMMADLGTQVTMLEALPKILPGCDSDVAEVVLRSFKRRGITVRTGVSVSGHEPGDGGTTVSFGNGESVVVEAVVMSVGRRPLSDTLGLEAAGVGVDVDDRGFVTVDEFMRTTAEGVYAVGDLVATPALAHVGFAEAIVAIRHLMGENPLPVDYGNVPWCIYSHPEVAFAGLSEQGARDAGFDVVTSKHRFASSSRAMIVGDTEGLVKVIAEKQPDGTGGRLLGVHMVGPWVTEQLGAGYLAVNWEATAADVAQFVQPHPTLSETFGETVMSLTGRGLHG